jgi:hypothetical protein
VVRDIEITRDSPVTVGTLRILRTGPNTLGLSWDTKLGLLYDLEEWSKLEGWSVQEPNIGGTGGEISRSHVISEITEKLFRVSARRL